MSLRSCIFQAALAAAVGCLIHPGVSARAGDKIEFSTPAVPLTVPQAPREEKSSARTSLSPADRPEDAIRQEQMADSSEVVVFAPAQGKSSSPWDRTSSNSRDGNTDETAPYNSLLSKPVTAFGQTNFWDDMGRGWDGDKRSIFSKEPDDQAVMQNGSLRDRMEAEASRKDDLWRGDRYGTHSRTGDDSVWSRNTFNDANAAWRPQVEQYQTYLDELKAKSEQQREAGIRPERSLWPDDSRRELNYSANAGLNWTPAEWASKRMDEQEQMSSSRTVQQAPSQSTTIFPDPYARLGPPPSPPGQVQSQPGILPFPKRPGSVFQ